MISKNNSKSLTTARVNKADEFYTSYDDIEKEVLSYPINIWKDKTVYLPCDNPAWSNFWKFFEDNFKALKLFGLWATFLETEKENACFTAKTSSDIITEDIITGDFRSDICKDIMKAADIIVTNPPFSLFREFLLQIVNFKKQFLLIGNINSVTNKQIFKLIMDNKLWLGSTIHSGDREFRVPDDYPLTAAGTRTDNNGSKFVRVKGVRWFTNIDYPDRYQTLPLRKDNILKRFDNYDALCANRTKDIPDDYYGVIGVPITFIDKYNPEQFDILGLDCMMLDNPRPNKRFLYDGKETYGRIMIQRTSKPLKNPDISAFELHRRIFGDIPTAAVNFDALYLHPQYCYVIFEFLLCDEKQTVTPYTSHPNRYWYKNWRKFVSLFQAAQKLNGHLILVNYAKEGTVWSNQIRMIRVISCDKDNGIIEQEDICETFDEFQAWFLNFNKECMTS